MPVNEYYSSRLQSYINLARFDTDSSVEHIVQFFFQFHSARQVFWSSSFAQCSPRNFVPLSPSPPHASPLLLQLPPSLPRKSPLSIIVKKTVSSRSPCTPLLTQASVWVLSVVCCLMVHRSICRFLSSTLTSSSSIYSAMIATIPVLKNGFKPLRAKIVSLSFLRVVAMMNGVLMLVNPLTVRRILLPLLSILHQ